MTFKIQVHPLSETILTQEGVHHPDHFSTFLINRERVEVVDFLVGIRSHGMTHRTCVFRELMASQ